METSFPLLSTKLFVPPPRQSLVQRPRLVERLSRGLMLPLSLISAPAGFGKTTLISEWRASNAGRDYPIAFLSLEGDDNDPIRFLTYFVTALGTLKPDLAESALGILQSPQPPPLQAFLTGVINDLNEIDHPFAIVLDDYHVISAEPIHEAMVYILDHMPRQMHLVLLTRSDPPLPLARLRVRNQLLEIRAEDMRFTPVEAADFFNRVMDLPLSADVVSALEQHTEGWIAGLQLAAVALQTPHMQEQSEDRAEFIRAFTGSHRYIADYLVAEVLSRQPEPVQSFLLQTSILDRMTAELCDQLTGRANSQAILRQVEGANLFLVPLDADRRWYRYHHLFADVLRSQLHQTFPEQIAGLHSHAADWFEQNNFVPEAIQHSLTAGDQLHAARIVEKNALPMLMRGDAVTVLKWIEALTPVIQDHLWLVIYQSWGYICTGQLEKIESALQSVETQINTSKLNMDWDAVRAHIAAIRALVFLRRGEVPHAIELGHQALECLPPSAANIHSVIVYTLGEANWLAGDLEGAKHAFSEASLIDAATGNVLAAVLALSSVAVLMTEQGELHRAAENYQTAIQMATRPNGRLLPAAARACLGLSSLEYEWNDLQASTSHLEQSLELGRRWGNPDTLAGIHLMKARLLQAEGDTPGAFELLNEADMLGSGMGLILPTIDQLNAFRVQLWLAQGNLIAASNWSRGQTSVPDESLAYSMQSKLLTQARILIAQGQSEPALKLLERLYRTDRDLRTIGKGA